MPDAKCRECDAVIETWFIHSEELLSKKLCFECYFWLEEILAAQNGDIFRNGRKVVRVRQEGGLWHYIIGPEDTSNEEVKLRGFGGVKFRIKFTAGPFEGQTITTTNLWCQGVIPERFWKRLPANALLTVSERCCNG